MVDKEVGLEVDMISMNDAVRTMLSIGALSLVSLGGANLSKAGKSFNVMGSYVEGCSCNAPCACEMTGLEMGCQGVGFFEFKSGEFDGRSLAGTKAAYAAVPGKWVMIYVDAPDRARMATCGEFMKAALSGFGKIRAVKAGKIAMTMKGMAYHVTVDGGKVMSLDTTPIMGGDGKHPMTYSNIHDVLHPTVMQGKTVRGSYSDAGEKFTLKDSNAYFNERLASKGKV